MQELILCTGKHSRIMNSLFAIFHLQYDVLCNTFRAHSYSNSTASCLVWYRRSWNTKGMWFGLPHFPGPQDCRVNEVWVITQLGMFLFHVSFVNPWCFRPFGTFTLNCILVTQRYLYYNYVYI